MIDDIVKKYLEVSPEEHAKLALLLAQLAGSEQMNTRKNFRGHITGGALVLSPDKKKILLIHHNVFNKWLQPGGHWDPEDASPLEAARREAIEETNVQIAHQLPVFDDPSVPIDISTHVIMARPERDEPAHHHHDFRYVFLAASEDLTHKPSEVSASTWVAFDDPRTETIRPLIEKLRRYSIIS